MRFGRTLSALLLAGVLIPPAATAHDHRPPRLLLEHDGQRQRGINYHGWWMARSDDGCVAWHAVGPRAFPDTAVIEPDPWAAIRLVKRQEPRKVLLKAWPLVGPGDQPVGSATLVDVDVRRVRGAATRQWGVVFDPPFTGDNYLELFVEWKDSEGCKGAEGGYWGFHLFSESL
ncbi:MAG TPA: hypothetical protein VHJ76_04070 [Actinomycetota bacterium]|nr:hypothetical protein [Actinomycetota bacterium]